MRSLFIAGFAICTAVAAPSPRSPTAEEIRDAIRDLDHAQYRVRTAAARRLIAAGSAAIDPLIKVANTGSAESADRAMKILEDLATQGEDSTRDLTRQALRQMAATSPRAGEILNRFRSQVLDRLQKAGAHFQFDGDNLRAIYLDRVEDFTPVMPLLLEFPEVQEVSAATKKFGDAEFKQLVPLKNIRWLNLFESDIGDESLKLLRHFENLDSVPMGHTRVTDDGLKNLGDLKKLEYIGLRGNQVTDAGLAHLKGLTSLKGITLEETAVTGAGFVHLQGLPLDNLRLMGSQFDDEGLKQLKDIKTLRRVDLSKTKVTGPAVQAISEALPDTLFVKDPSE